MKVLYLTMAIATVLAVSWFAVYQVNRATQADLPPVQPRSTADVPLPIANEIKSVTLTATQSTSNNAAALPNFAPIPHISQVVKPHQHVHNTSSGALIIPQQLAHQINTQLRNNLDISDLPGKRFTNGQVVIATQGRLKSISAVSLNEQGKLVFHEHREPIAINPKP